MVPIRRTVAFVAALAPGLVQACGRAGADGQARAPTYADDVAPILATSCASCHRTGGIAPFPLLTYDDAVAHGTEIAAVTADRAMPPFNLDNSGACRTYANARWLDDAAIATLAAWVGGGMPRGDRELPPLTPPPQPVLGRVDLTLDMGASYTPSTSAEDDYRCFVIDPKLAGDRFVTGFDVHPGEPRMVHHLTLFAFDSADAERQADALDAADPGPGYACFGDTIAPSRWLVGSGPGSGALSFPEGTGLRMKAGRKTVLQIHYNRRNGTFADRTTIDLALASSVRTEAFVPRLADLHLRLPPHRESVAQTDTQTLPESVTLWGVWPHMHNLGSKLRVSAEHDGQEQCIVQVNRWDFHWQGFANYAQPIELDAGDPMTIRCTYDTTSRDAQTLWGTSTDDEMCIAFFYATPR